MEVTGDTRQELGFLGRAQRSALQSTEYPTLRSAADRCSPVASAGPDEGLVGLLDPISVVWECEYPFLSPPNVDP